ncbi:IQ domain-containing protein K isoform X5 [Symphalangus syndactylus]|uniref:IQ domain-containing protein K isoform X5 n=1 Tax=Symphalangus syndactylus TaxID=9590 RepID=UPI00244157B9|nr:IQ domain-containing protein K isoform X4 [Symphalangus syndactylus]
MAAPRQVPSHIMPRKPSCSTNSSFTRTPVSTVSLESRELPVSPWQVAEPSSKSLWEQICEEYEAEQPPFPEGYKVKQEPVITVAPVEEMLFHGFSTEHYFPVSHFTMISHTPCPQDKSETVNPKTCSPKEYLETFIFPVLLPGMASLLHQAKKEKCFEPTAANHTLPPADRRGSSPLHSILLESLCGNMENRQIQRDCGSKDTERLWRLQQNSCIIQDCFTLLHLLQRPVSLPGTQLNSIPSSHGEL